MNCVVCTDGKYKDNVSGHITCQPCDASGKVVTQGKTKCELCPSVSIVYFLPVDVFVPIHP